MIRLAEAERTLPAEAARLLPALHRSDDLADAAVAGLADLPAADRRPTLERAVSDPNARDLPEALAAVVAQASEIPDWVDEAACRRAGRLLFRAGTVGGFVLGVKSLVLGYAAPGGNKPLVLSGRLYNAASVGKRLAETARFVMEVGEDGGMAPFAKGWGITLKVRLMHAQVRKLVLESGQWRPELWGQPINQHDMVGTVLIFSRAWLEGVEQLGLHVSPLEADDYVHLWSRVGHVIGVEPQLRLRSTEEARRAAALIELTQAAPDEDARRLVRSFLEAPLEAAETPAQRRAAQARLSFARAMCAELLGPERARDLDVRPSLAWAPVPAAIRRGVRAAEALRRRSPELDASAYTKGRAHWDKVVALGELAGPSEFALPDALKGVLRSAA